MEQDDKDWGNLRFRKQARYSEGAPEDNANARFVISLLVFLAVAAVYPAYSYWVQSRLVAAELDAAAKQLKTQAAAESARMQRQVQAMDARNRAVAQRQRVAGVRVVGASLNDGAPVVIVQLGGASLSEAKQTICLQAASRLGRPMRGMSLRVLRDEGRGPAVTSGTLHCAD